MTPDTPTPPLGTGSLLRAAWTEISDELFASLLDAGYDDLRSVHRPILRDLLALELRPSELAARMGLSKQAVNDIVRELEGKGYISLQADPDDGRSKRIVATARGREAYDTAQEAAQGVGDRWADLVGEDRYAVFLGVLREIAAAGEHDGRDARGVPSRALIPSASPWPSRGQGPPAPRRGQRTTPRPSPTR